MVLREPSRQRRVGARSLELAVKVHEDGALAVFPLRVERKEDEGGGCSGMDGSAEFGEVRGRVGLGTLRDGGKKTQTQKPARGGFLRECTSVSSYHVL